MIRLWSGGVTLAVMIPDSISLFEEDTEDALR